jgi:hypothetical protein
MLLILLVSLMLIVHIHFNQTINTNSSSNSGSNSASSSQSQQGCDAPQGASDQPYVAPNGAVFCSPDQRVGVLPRMLKELLETRIMVKVNGRKRLCN